jgi:hypothetical protein
MVVARYGGKTENYLLRFLHEFARATMQWEVR